MRLAHENAKIYRMKTVLPIDADPASATPISPTDFHHILAEKDRAIAERDALIAYQKAARNCCA